MKVKGERLERPKRIENPSKEQLKAEAQAKTFARELVLSLIRSRPDA